jgi:hypothetical protein
MLYAAITEYNLESAPRPEAGQGNTGSGRINSAKDAEASAAEAIPASALATKQHKQQPAFVPRDMFPMQFGKQKTHTGHDTAEVQHGIASGSHQKGR